MSAIQKDKWVIAMPKNLDAGSEEISGELLRFKRVEGLKIVDVKDFLTTLASLNSRISPTLSPHLG